VGRTSPNWKIDLQCLLAELPFSTQKPPSAWLWSLQCRTTLFHILCRKPARLLTYSQIHRCLDHDFQKPCSGSGMLKMAGCLRATKTIKQAPYDLPRLVFFRFRGSASQNRRCLEENQAASMAPGCWRLVYQELPSPPALLSSLYSNNFVSYQKPLDDFAWLVLWLPPKLSMSKSMPSSRRPALQSKKPVNGGTWLLQIVVFSSAV
jgi:hypothetical protein